MEEKSSRNRPIDERLHREPTPEPARLASILSACRAGEAEAFESLFDHYKDYVYSVAFHLSRDPELAADATQEVFLKLIDRIDRFQERSRFATWLYRVVYNTVRDLQRQIRPAAPLDDLPEPAAPVSPGGSLDKVLSRDAAGVLRRAMNRLSERLRAPLVLRYVADLSYSEIAEILEISPGTVASRLSRAHEQLAREVPRDSVEVP